jgi:DNA-binding NarL/FixJ family response regulator
MEPSRTTTRVLIVDDHAVVRAGMRALLDPQRDIEIVGEADSGARALAQVQELAPDVVTLDISMPNAVATRVTKQIRRVAPATAILVFTGHEEPFYIHAMLDSGAHGYLSKRASEHLAEAIRLVHQGERYVCHIAAAALEGPEAPASAGEPTDPALRRAVSRLSPRERAVLLRIAQGYTYQEIAEQLGIGVNSVGTYRARLAEKLGVKGRRGLVRVGLASGLVAPPGRSSGGAGAR